MEWVFMLHALLLAGNVVCTILNGMMFLKYGEPINAIVGIFNGGVSVFLLFSYPLLLPWNEG